MWENFLYQMYLFWAYNSVWSWDIIKIKRYDFRLRKPYYYDGTFMQKPYDSASIFPSLDALIFRYIFINCAVNRKNDEKYSKSVQYETVGASAHTMCRNSKKLKFREYWDIYYCIPTVQRWFVWRRRNKG